MPTTIDENEIVKFEQLSNQWWDKNGKFKPLHMINPIRLQFIQETIKKYYTNEKTTKILDIGCGGGLVSEPLAKLGYNVKGIDASDKNIKIATLHAQQNNVQVRYAHSLIENESQTNSRYNVVLALEIVEHVNDINFFLQNCSKVVDKNGLLIISTINKNLKSLLTAKIAAEYILRWLPAGTHDWQKFVKPSTIHNILNKMNFDLITMKGIGFNPIKWDWQLTDNIDINYFTIFKKY